MKQNGISKAMLERLPLYLRYLKNQSDPEEMMVSSTIIARALDLGDVQVRKDLGIVSGSGRPKIGYVKAELITQIEEYLGFGTVTKALIVGAGRLGRALLDFEGFGEFGLNVVAAFDADEAKCVKSETNKPIYPISKLSDFCKSEKPEIGIITVPESAAEEVCDLMIANGIKAVWNFTGARLRVPEGTVIRNENLASSLAVLSAYLHRA